MSDSWLALRRFTQARIALGRAGHAVLTPVLLEFQLAHAEARDAVHIAWDVTTFAGQVQGLGQETIILDTPVTGRSEYLRRPDLGRVLSAESQDNLRTVHTSGVDVALIVTNGLSSTAVERHGMPLLQAIVNCYREHRISIAPIALVPNGRVALADEIGSLLTARVAVIIVGERPGLSAADSLGIYLTFAPQPGNCDAQRNCISNIRPPEGLGYAEAAAKLLYLTVEAMERGISGVALKDEMAELHSSNVSSIPS
jgi:ethanolamine ammonia-lyase small subunit